MLNSFISRSDGLWDPIIKLSIHSECNPKIAGGYVGHFYQFSCLHQRPIHAIEQCSFVTLSKFLASKIFYEPF
jgi:hypothetical protein